MSKADTTILEWRKLNDRSSANIAETVEPPKLKFMENVIDCFICYLQSNHIWLMESFDRKTFTDCVIPNIKRDFLSSLPEDLISHGGKKVGIADPEDIAETNEFESLRSMREEVQEILKQYSHDCDEFEMQTTLDEDIDYYKQTMKQIDKVVNPE